MLAGTALGNVHVYDVPSHQLLRTINAHPGLGLAVTHLTTHLKPPDLVGHVQLGGDKDGGIPVLPIVPFHRMREARPREAHEVTMMLPHARNVRVFFFWLLYRPAGLSNTYGGTLRQITHDSVTTYEREELLRDWEFFVKPRTATTVEYDTLSTPRPDGRVTELEDEVARLRSQLARAKGINDVMWETFTQTAAAEEKELVAPDQVFDSREDAADVRERKRGKTKA